MTAFTREVVAAHLKAFPAVTPAATAGPPLWGWLLALGSAVGATTAAIAVARLRAHRKRIRSIPRTPIDPSRIRVDW